MRSNVGIQAYRRHLATGGLNNGALDPKLRHAVVTTANWSVPNIGDNQ